MDPKHIGDVLKHLEKQNELLTEAYRSMSHELHTLQVEEEMLMRKYYEFMVAQGLVEKKQSSTDATQHNETGGSLVDSTQHNETGGSLVDSTQHDETGGALVTIQPGSNSHKEARK